MLMRNDPLSRRSTALPMPTPTPTPTPMRMRMRMWMRLLMLMTLVTASGAGCQNALYDDNLRYRQQNQDLQARVTQLETELGRRPDAAQVAELQSALAERDARLAQFETTLRTPQPGVSTPGIEGIETEFDDATGEMTVRLPGDVLFDSGVATLKPSARTTLDKVAAALNNEYSGKLIRVEGHTDSDPLVKTRSQWGDNRNLSLARARAVTQHLEQRGVEPKRIATVGYGEHHPLGNDKPRNRRVEVVVVTR